MTDTEMITPIQFHPHAGRVKAGGALIAFALVAGGVGALIAGIEMATATRRWLNESGRPPSEVARRTMRQMAAAGQAASLAALDAWQHSGDGSVQAGVKQ